MEEKVDKKPFDIEQLTSENYTKYKTNLSPNYDIGMGQAGIYINGSSKEKSELVCSKIQHGLKEFNGALNTINNKLYLNSSNFDIRNKECIKKVLTDTKAIEESQLDDLAKNIYLLIKSIEQMTKDAEKLHEEGNDLAPEALIYLYCKIGIVLDLLTINPIKSQQVHFISINGDSRQIDYLKTTTAMLQSIPSLTNDKVLKESIGKILPNAKKTEDTRNTSDFYHNFNIIPIEHKLGLIGLSTIVYSILNDKIPLGIGVNVHPVHYGYFMKQRLYTLDHDYQHALDILRKSSDFYSMQSPLKSIYDSLVEKYQKSSNNSNEVNEGKKDILVLFYLLHENPFLFRTTSSYLDAYYQTPEFKEGDSPKEKNKRTKYALSQAVFEYIGYIHAFIELYPEFKNRLKEETRIIVNEKNKIRAPLDFTSIELEKTKTLLEEYMGRSIEAFYERHKDILQDGDILSKKMIREITSFRLCFPTPCPEDLFKI